MSLSQTLALVVTSVAVGFPAIAVAFFVYELIREAESDLEELLSGGDDGDRDLRR